MSWMGVGSTAESDFNSALTFSSVFRAPVILNSVNYQWAISSFQGIAGGLETTFASKAIGYGLPALRVDGNDFLAVWAATQWAEERARTNQGATVIELFTYRGAPHSTSDDPSRYRPGDEHEKWPLGDPLERLKQHLIVIGEWSDDQHEAAEKDAVEQVRAAAKESEAIGTLGQSRPSVKTMFEEVYATEDWRITEQRREVGV
jgi:2-oxoisovalerate dehydrogenase E1 component alpha subunit